MRSPLCCSLLLVMGVYALTSCGTIGPPVAPDSIGVRAKLAKERSEKERLLEQAAQGTDQDQQRMGPEEAGGGQEFRADDGRPADPGFSDHAVEPAARPSGDVFIRPR